MNNIVQAENAAVAEVEEIFKVAGWSDGWELTDDEVRRAKRPLFYRNNTSAVAEEARPILNGERHSLYCIYNVAPTDPKYSENKPHHFEVTIALTFYYDDPFLFHGNGAASKFIDELMNGFANRLWVIVAEGEQSVPPTENKQAYENRKLMFVSNVF